MCTLSGSCHPLHTHTVCNSADETISTEALGRLMSQLYVILTLGIFILSFSGHDKSLLMETGELRRRSLSCSSGSVFSARESFSRCLLPSPSLDAKALHRQPLYYTEYTLIRSLIERFPLMGSRRRAFLGRAWCNTYRELFPPSIQQSASEERRLFKVLFG